LVRPQRATLGPVRGPSHFMTRRVLLNFAAPAAEGQSTATYEYFVAVTRKNIGVINKQTFPLQVTFPEGEDRVRVVERVDEYVIPRADEGTSGENFEIIIGFEVTEAQRQFNAEGKRFRVSAGQ